MTARLSIEREAIIDACLGIMREGGWASVTARAIAARLGASTMPIYSGIGSMAELKKAANARVGDLLRAEQRKPRTGDAAMDMAIGYVAFAREEPRLFRFLLGGEGQEGGAANEAKEPAVRVVEEGERTEIADVPPLASLLAEFADPERRNDFVLRSWIFAHGLASLLAGGVFSMGDEEIIRHLSAAGGAFYELEKCGEGR
jgi:AcrR family transcriptional regulator